MSRNDYITAASSAFSSSVFIFYINGGQFEKRFIRHFINYVCRNNNDNNINRNSIEDNIDNSIKWDECTRKRLVVASRRAADALLSINRKVYWPTGDLFSCQILNRTQRHDQRRHRQHHYYDQRRKYYHRSVENDYGNDHVDVVDKGNNYDNFKTTTRSSRDDFTFDRQWKRDSVQNKRRRQTTPPNDGCRRRKNSSVSLLSLSSPLKGQLKAIVHDRRHDAANINDDRVVSTTVNDGLLEANHHTPVPVGDNDWYIDGFVDIEVCDEIDDMQL
ncbi:LEF6 [Hemileuca sp. nucleopolyhedrovirus]|uniref:LEF6 n=1 Tax=Hemileuca sp. nucleopolyhedrovirus TaxID=1367203 RepID=S5N951_9ABAC|nr:LEF6 [Hemileuca sp. nucleopolyhedrovirus]AGR56772.1 LEF6 [Hemileuca sp. nucleopolyhedrovirus]